MNRTFGFLTLAASLLLAAGCAGGDAPDDAPSEASTSGSDDGTTNPSGTAASAGEDGATPAEEGSPLAVDAPDDTGDGTAGGPDAPSAGEDDPASTTPSMGEDGPDGQAPVGDGDDTDALIGLWDYTRATEAGTDVALFSITAGGVVTEYDYRDDAPGDGRACHVVGTASIASRGDDRYDIQSSSTLPGANGIDDVLITVANGEITFRYLGDAFDPEFGAGQAGITETYPAVTDRRADQLAICET